jgi:hypothetical protein
MSLEPEVPGQGNNSRLDIDCRWPAKRITGIDDSTIDADCFGLVWLNDPPNQTEQNDILSLLGSQVTFANVAFGQPPAVIGQATCRMGYCQLSITDLANFVSSAAETGVEIVTNPGDLGVYSIQAGHFRNNGYGVPGPQGGPIGRAKAVRLTDLGAFMTIPGGWWQFPQLYTNGVSATPLAAGSRYLRNSEMSERLMQSCVVPVPSTARFLLLRGWAHLAYAFNPTTMIQATINIW